MKNLISIDVEDYNHVFGDYNQILQSKNHYNKKFSCVDSGCRKFLKKLNLNKKKGTFFFLASIARNHKSLIEEIVNQGHEIASHGYNHQPLNLISIDNFKNDLIESKKILEDISQQNIMSYRAPGFSLTKNYKSIYNILIENGFKISSSTIIKKTDFGGNFGLSNNIYKIYNKENKFIYEVPVFSYPLLGNQFIFSGGGHLRFTPLKFINKFTNTLNKNNKIVNFYIHPRELIYNHKRLKMNFKRYFKSYYNIKSVEKKIDSILENYDCDSFINMFTNNNFTKTQNLYL